MGLLVNVVWGDSWRRPKEGLGRVVDSIQAVGATLPEPANADDPSVDVYIYVSGSVWQHDREGFKLGTLSARGRSWLRVMIYVPDDLTTEEASRLYFARTFDDIAEAVESRLRQRRPEWPIETLVEQLRGLTHSA